MTDEYDRLLGLWTLESSNSPRGLGKYAVKFEDYSLQFEKQVSPQTGQVLYTKTLSSKNRVFGVPVRLREGPDILALTQRKSDGRPVLERHYKERATRSKTLIKMRYRLTAEGGGSFEESIKAVRSPFERNIDGYRKWEMDPSGQRLTLRQGKLYGGLITLVKVSGGGYKC